MSYNSGEEIEIDGIFSFLEREGSINGVGAFHEWLSNDLDSTESEYVQRMNFSRPI